MSSGFVPASDSSPKPPDPASKPLVNDEWEAAKAVIEQRRQEREAASREESGKSLYETLQANKAAKQDAFEEANRLRNQFRSLDEDEVDFLDSVLESTRTREEEVKKETSELLELFRKQQEAADKAVVLGDDPGDEKGAGSPIQEREDWGVGMRKRKKGPGRDRQGVVLKGVKIRRVSSSAGGAPDKSEPDGVMKHHLHDGERGTRTTGQPSVAIETTLDSKPLTSATSPIMNNECIASTEARKTPLAATLGLGYSSNSDDE